MESWTSPAFLHPVSFFAGHKSSFVPSRTERKSIRPCHARSRRVQPTARVRRGQKPDPEIPKNLFEAEPIKDIDFKDFNFAQLKDKVVMVVNVASDDDFTDVNYKMFTKMLEKYHSQGLEILAFPDNWFGQRETRPLPEIKKFVHGKYTDKIKLMGKVDLDWDQVFALAQKYYPGEIIWNFHGKFLFNRSGLPVGRFDLLSTPEYVEEAISEEIRGGYVDPIDPDLADMGQSLEPDNEVLEFQAQMSDSISERPEPEESTTQAKAEQQAAVVDEEEGEEEEVEEEEEDGGDAFEREPEQE